LRIGHISDTAVLFIFCELLLRGIGIRLCLEVSSEDSAVGFALCGNVFQALNCEQLHQMAIILRSPLKIRAFPWGTSVFLMACMLLLLIAHNSPLIILRHVGETWLATGQFQLADDPLVELELVIQPEPAGHAQPLVFGQEQVFRRVLLRTRHAVAAAFLRVPVKLLPRGVRRHGGLLLWHAKQTDRYPGL
jgi:hypothetical protein